MSDERSINDIRVIIVDDLASYREILREIMRMIGVTHVTEAVNGQEAFEKIIMAAKGNEHFDLIISDINMPKMNGLELLKNVRGAHKLGKVPFILVSTENEKKIIIEALVLEISDYLIKPYDIATASNKIKKIILKILQTP
ncbi:MAG: response regulator [Bacteriovoracaceae bacterium]|nr:response regulator [Bacteriovoracaceae bacterium]